MPHPLEKLPYALCSVERARELELDVAKVRTCHPERVNGVAGCPVWRSCRFNRKEYGGFKGTRPHFIGYYFRALDGSHKTDICACHSFVNSLQPQMDAGLARRAQGLSHMLVRIVAQEGQSIKVMRYPQTSNSRGELVTKERLETISVPTYPDPTERDSTLAYEREIMAEYDDAVAGEVAPNYQQAGGELEPGNRTEPLAAPVSRVTRKP